jgi:hypothetical protein
MSYVQVTKRPTQPPQRFLNHRTTRTFALHAQHTVISNIPQDGQHLPDVLRVHAVADGTMAYSDPSLLTADRGG